ncbi:GNAT family N-acetyltransferase [Psychrobacillus sp. FSL K6-1464]|uniref:GNAT family N-acetyltransferase n=1 Tax=Psychrobacillus sp. FSL K6-1464 TaxID=2921545 RepID=UPI0030F73F9F
MFLSNSNINFTNRMLRIWKKAENHAQSSRVKVLQPVHLLTACLDEKTGVLGEISLKITLDKSLLKDVMEDTSIQHQTFSVFLNVQVTEEVKNVLEVAIIYMKKYNQIYVNEGHLLKALIKTNVVDYFLSDDNRKTILSLGTTSRDMITHIGNYTVPIINTHLIRKVNKKEINELVHFIGKNFSNEWSQTIREAFSLNKPPVYVAFDDNGDIIGFAAYDIYKNKKCYFGPMGVSLSNRVKGIGYSLLHHCLKDMSDIGYEYAIIGQAGPLEFYEKACNAVVIPSNKV